MLQSLRQNSEKGQAAVILALTMIGLLAIVGLAIDGGMLYWNQRRAQNGADAAAIAGTTALMNQVLSENYNCAESDEQPIIDMVEQYAHNNEVPDEANTIEMIYLVQDYVTKRRYDMPGPGGRVWHVGDTGRIPCEAVVNAINPNYDLAGIHVKAAIPQDTFLAGVIGIAETRATADAYAIFEYRTWCTDFAIYTLSTSCNRNDLQITGSGFTVAGAGIHSNSGLYLEGSEQGIFLEPGRPVEYGARCATNINTNKVTGGPNPAAPDRGIRAVEAYSPPDDFFYDFEDFAPGGYIEEEIPDTMYHYFPVASYPHGIGNNEVQNADGTLRDGVYVVESGDIHLNNLTQDPNSTWRVTFVLRGKIHINGSFSQRPAARSIFIFTESHNFNPGAVKISGSNNRWEGLIMAPRGSVSMSGANNSDLSGMIVGYTIDIQGSDNVINHRPEYCPMNPPRVRLVN